MYTYIYICIYMYIKYGYIRPVMGPLLWTVTVWGGTTNVGSL